MAENKSSLEETLLDQKYQEGVDSQAMAMPTRNSPLQDQVPDAVNFDTEEYKPTLIQKSIYDFIFIEEREIFLTFDQETKIISQYSYPSNLLKAQQRADEENLTFWNLSSYNSKTFQLKGKKYTLIADIDTFFKSGTSMKINLKNQKVLGQTQDNSLVIFDTINNQFVMIDTDLNPETNQVLNFNDIPTKSKLPFQSQSKCQEDNLEGLTTFLNSYQFVWDKENQKILFIDFKEQMIKDDFLLYSNKKCYFQRFEFTYLNTNKLELDSSKGYFEITKIQFKVPNHPSLYSAQLIGYSQFYTEFQNGFYSLNEFDLKTQAHLNQIKLIENGLRKFKMIRLENQDYFYYQDHYQLYCNKIKKVNQIIRPYFQNHYNDFLEARCNYYNQQYYTRFYDNKIEFFNIKSKQSIVKELNNSSWAFHIIQELSIVLIPDSTRMLLISLDDPNYFKELYKSEKYCPYTLIKNILYIIDDQDNLVQFIIKSSNEFEKCILQTNIYANRLKYFDNENVLVAYSRDKDKPVYILSLQGEINKELVNNQSDSDIVDIQNNLISIFLPQNQKTYLLQLNINTNQTVNKFRLLNDLTGYYWESYNNYLISLAAYADHIIFFNRQNIQPLVIYHINYCVYDEILQKAQYDEYRFVKEKSKDGTSLFIHYEMFFKEIQKVNMDMPKPFEKYIPYSSYFEYDSKTETYTYFNDYNEKYKICQFSSKCFQTDINHFKDSLNQDDHNVIKYLRENELNKFLINPYPYTQSYLYHIALRPRVIEEFVKKLQFADKDTLPLLLQLDRYGQTPFDIAIEKNQTKSISLFIDMMIRFQENFALNWVFDKHICLMLEKGYSLQEYFQSKLPIYQIQESCYPPLDKNDLTKIYICNYDSPIDILKESAYNEIIGQDLQEQRQNEQENLQAIDYYMINIPKTLTNKNLSQLLSRIDQMELFDSLCIQTIVNFKWNNYTFSFFFKQFLIFLSFVLIFLIDFYYSIYKDVQGLEIDYYSVTLKIIATLILCYFIAYEIRSAMQQTVSEYIKDMWNYFDFLLIAIYIAFAIVDFQNYSLSLRNILVCAVLLLAFVKLNFFLRIFDGFSFMVSMMQGVFFDLKYFMAFFLMTVVEFGLLFTVLVRNSDTYESIGTVGYFLMAFRTSLGDFELDDYGTTIETDGNYSLEIIILRWIIWIVGVFVMNIVFMNFIIAVISESYEKVMQKLVAQSYKVKIDMIAERELHFNDADFNNNQLFPKYLILRKPVDGEEQNGQEWQGFVKDLKLHVSKNVVKSKIELQNNITVMQKGISELDEKLKKNQENFKNVDSKFESQDQRLQSLEMKLNQLIDHLIPKQE